ncbi:MAG: hypothetical protein HY075_08465 [Deltaproteobacteria bacterium]|nr:hypothetical protein [Deltaproteobacteria bacterium]
MPNSKAIKLCAGAESRAPLECYKATPESVSDANALELCSGATTKDGPLECYKAVPAGISDAQAARQCRKALPAKKGDVAGAPRDTAVESEGGVKSVKPAAEDGSSSLNTTSRKTPTR